ncbi:MAG: magnesium transporter CorA family protein, partial [Nanoarchaeota archaeon]|nr:magnesium transporter CorA family protein [Nanoarchaeota archaeon]
MIEIFKSSKGKLIPTKKPGKGCWINLICPTEEELSKVNQIVNIPQEIISSLKDVDEMPDMEKEDNLFFIVTRTPRKNSNNAELEYSTIPLGIIILDNCLITLCFNENDVITQLKTKKVYTAKKIQTTLRILLISAKTYLSYLNMINKKVHIIQEGLEKTMKNEDILGLLNIQKSLVYFSTSLKSNQFLIERLTKTKVFTQFEHDKELLEDMTEENKQAIEMAKIYSNILSGMADTSASLISNNLNNVMKLLTSITLILMLPTLVASIYGMNITLPFQRSPYAFLITMAISVVLAIIGVIILWKKKLF